MLFRSLGIPIIAICDTNSDPDLITVPIAGNDDAIRSVELIAGAIADTIAEARREAPLRPDAEEPAEMTTWSSERGTERESNDRRSRGGAGARPRRRRANPEAIAARLKGGAAEGDEAATESAE